MNILKRELRAGLKIFLFWLLGLFLLVFIGIIKYQGLSSGGANLTDFTASFPRIVQAVMGIVGVNINTLGGYTAILTYYVLICAIIYTVHLGSAAVTRESIDKTYEFVFTKPCSRSRILFFKLLAAWIFLALFCIGNVVFSILAVKYLKTAETVTMQISLFTLSVFLIGSLFIALSAFLSVMVHRPEKGALYGNLAFLYTFIIGVIYNMLENPGLLKLISPMTYYLPPDLIAEKFDPLITVLIVLLSAVLLTATFKKFNKLDMA